MRRKTAKSGTGRKEISYGAPKNDLGDYAVESAGFQGEKNAIRRFTRNGAQYHWRYTKHQLAKRIVRVLAQGCVDVGQELRRLGDLNAFRAANSCSSELMSANL
jgi:hypothetical protein